MSYFDNSPITINHTKGRHGFIVILNTNDKYYMQFGNLTLYDINDLSYYEEISESLYNELLNFRMKQIERAY